VRGVVAHQGRETTWGVRHIQISGQGHSIAQRNKEVAFNSHVITFCLWHRAPPLPSPARVDGGPSQRQSSETETEPAPPLSVSVSVFFLSISISISISISVSVSISVLPLAIPAVLLRSPLSLPALPEAPRF